MPEIDANTVAIKITTDLDRCSGVRVRQNDSYTLK